MPAHLEENPIVTTSLGPVRGKLDHATGQHRFLGIPYAEPPVGALRFRPPRPKAPWVNQRDCSRFGAAGVRFSIRPKVPMRNSPMPRPAQFRRAGSARRTASPQCLAPRGGQGQECPWCGFTAAPSPSKARASTFARAIDSWRGKTSSSSRSTTVCSYSAVWI